ncbi:MAG: hypothetical protein H6704_30355 [Myxococcales bacterium]|nr:hypothetical protein [Myxococcales bacterium]
MRDFVAFEPYPEAPALIAWFGERFGIPAAVFADFAFWHRAGSPAIWMTAAAVTPPPGLGLEALGVMTLRKPPPAGKPTSIFLMKVGAHATRRVFDLDDATAARFLAREPISVDDTETYGHVVVRDALGVLGCGMLADGVLVSELPRSWTLGEG